jgi:hypothetical protein
VEDRAHERPAEERGSDVMHVIDFVQNS